MSDNAASHLEMLIDLLFSPIGMIGMLVFLVALVFVVAMPRLKWVALTAAMFVSTIGTFENEWFSIYLTWPLNYLDTYNRQLLWALLMMLVLPAVLVQRGYRSQLILYGAWGYLFFRMVLSVREVAAVSPARGLLGMIVLLMLFVVLVYGLSKWLQSLADVRRLLWCFVWVGVLFVLATVHQLVVNRHSMMPQGRLFAVAGNPQYTGIIIPFILLPVGYLFAQRDTSKALKMFLLGPLAGILVIFLIWTGSRTGMMMTLVAMVVLFRFRLGQWAAVIIIGGIFALIALQFFSESGEMAGRLFSTANTRAQAWGILLRGFLRNPLLGVPLSETPDATENSYLVIAARSGLIGLLPLLAAMALVLMHMVTIHRSRRAMGEQMLLADMVTAGVSTLAVGAVFEGYLIATLSFMIFAIMIYLSLMAFVIEAARHPWMLQMPAHAVHVQPDESFGWDMPQEPAI